MLLFMSNVCRRKDPEACTELMKLHMTDMYRVALAILMNDEDVSDAIQDTILACWEKIHTLKHRTYFRTWMTRILINKSYDIRGKQKMMVDIEECKELAIEEQSNLELLEALSMLDEKYRVPITLFYCEGYRTPEIAEVMGISESTVRTRMQRAREQLAAYYKE